MCGCSANFNGDERDIITQDELSRDFDFTGNRPSIIEVGETWEDPSFDFTGNRPSEIDLKDDNAFDFVGDVENDPQFDGFLGKKARARRQERKLVRQGGNSTRTETITDETKSGVDEDKSTYGGGWFGRNWHLLLIGAIVVGGGYYIYKKRK